MSCFQIIVEGRLAELKVANDSIELGLSEDVLRARWDKYGGVARWVLAAGDGRIGAGILRKAVGMMTDGGMKRLLDPFSN